jgi:hypothetical protein
MINQLAKQMAFPDPREHVGDVLVQRSLDEQAHHDAGPLIIHLVERKIRPGSIQRQLRLDELDHVASRRLQI